MEMNSHQNLLISRKFANSQSLKIVTQLFLSVSVFSFLFSHYTYLHFLHSLNFCFSTFPYQLFTHTLDKNFMFLICNGLLVFLAKYSGLARSLSLSSHDQAESRSKNFIESAQSELSMQQNKELMFWEKEVEIPETISSKENVAVEETEVEIKEAIIEGKERVQGSGIMASKVEDKEEDETSLVHVAEEAEENNSSNDDGFLAEQGSEEEEEDNKEVEEEEEEEEVGNGMLSTEELNKKFDEFIRRRKEELRIEAQRQLIMAV